ncbi:MAG: DUF4352 domain-containing protein [Actinobacteria bacterium]|nr:DUF4352 domain-containing protein [Actinomycetota bacterium]MBU1943663.1 DUF4352 domain-containing protein [Actinomycetota bacterium]MBU2686193.1 DUF4352 domain-containing protein [Actinomycetota bacterium]
MPVQQPPAYQQPGQQAPPGAPGQPVQPGYPQYAYPPPPQAQQKSSGVLKGCLIAFGIVTLVTIIVVVVLVAVVGVGVHKVVKEITNRETVSVGVGQVGKTGQLDVKVVGWSPSQGDDVFKPAQGNQFVVVDVSITNTGTTSKLVSTVTEMSVRTPNGYQYDMAVYFPEPRFPEGDILPGQTARGNVSFEVPSNATGMSFVYKPLIIGDVVSVKLN